MASVAWTVAARTDLVGIRDYIAADSIDHAIEFVDRLVASTDRLAQFPFSGKQLPEFPESPLREIVAYDYRIIYEVRADRAVIHAVLHAQ